MTPQAWLIVLGALLVGFFSGLGGWLAGRLPERLRRGGGAYLGGVTTIAMLAAVYQQLVAHNHVMPFALINLLLLLLLGRWAGQVSERVALGSKLIGGAQAALIALLVVAPPLLVRHALAYQHALLDARAELPEPGAETPDRWGPDVYLQAALRRGMALTLMTFPELPAEPAAGGEDVAPDGQGSGDGGDGGADGARESAADKPASGTTALGWITRLSNGTVVPWTTLPGWSVMALWIGELLLLLAFALLGARGAADADDDAISLWDDAMRRLKRNKMSLLGALITAVIGLAALHARLLSPIDPTYQQSWAGVRAPGDVHPLKQDEMVLQEGKRADFPPPALRKLGTRRFVAKLVPQQALEFELRVNFNVRKGYRITKIQRTGGGLPPERVKRVEVSGAANLRQAGNPDSPALRELTLAQGEPLPERLRIFVDHTRLSRGRGVVNLRRLEPGEPSSLTWTLERGVVKGLLLDGQPPQLDVGGGAKAHAICVLVKDVQGLQRDGKPVMVHHPLGTDHSGRDLFARILFGGKISFMIGLVATFVSLVIGVLYGAIAGYFGGTVDNLMMRIVDILYGLPYMFLVIILMVAFGRNVIVLFVALGAVQWLTMARIIRGQVLSLKAKEFIEAARAAGAGHLWIITRHLIPNTLGVVAVYTTLTIPAVILQESFLAFIGLGVDWGGQPLESWGSLTNAGKDALGLNGESWWLLVFPAATLSLALFSLNFLGDGLRDALDPQMKGRS